MILALAAEALVKIRKSIAVFKRESTQIIADLQWLGSKMLELEEDDHIA